MDIHRLEGLSGIYRGITPMMLRDVLPYGIYMLVYEYMLGIEERLHRVKRDRLSSGSGGMVVSSPYEASLIAMAGAMAGIISWMFIVPFDVVKTVMQSETDPTVHKNMLHCFRTLIDVSMGSKWFIKHFNGFHDFFSDMDGGHCSEEASWLLLGQHRSTPLPFWATNGAWDSAISFLEMQTTEVAGRDQIMIKDRYLFEFYCV